MKKLITILTLVLVIATGYSQTPVNVSIDVGFTSKLIQQGALIGSNFITAGVGVSVYGVDLGLDTYSAYQANNGVRGGYKLLIANAGYTFKSDLANLTFGADLRNADTAYAFNKVKSDVLPFVRIDGHITEMFVWDATALNDTKNRSNNYEANVRLPINTGLVKGLKVVPAVGVGFNDPGAPTLAVLKNDKHYATAGIGLNYYGIYVDGFVHRVDVTTKINQVVGYDVGYKLKF